MNTILLLLVYNLVSAISAFAAFWLAYHDKAGWGWFLFAAIICEGAAVVSKPKADENQKDSTTP